MKAYAVTDVGRTRDTNQDYFYYSSEPVGNLPNLYLVADGMGGHKAGDLASRFTVENVVRLVESYKDYRDPVTILAKAINEANGMLIEEARTHVNKNIITRAIGVLDDVSPELFSVDLTESSILLLCSDGLTNMVSDQEILEIIKSEDNIKGQVEELVRKANENGGKDNITAMIINPL